MLWNNFKMITTTTMMMMTMKLLKVMMMIMMESSLMTMTMMTLWPCMMRKRRMKMKMLRSHSHSLAFRRSWWHGGSFRSGVTTIVDAVFAWCNLSAANQLLSGDGAWCSLLTRARRQSALSPRLALLQRVFGCLCISSPVLLEGCGSHRLWPASKQRASDANQRAPREWMRLVEWCRYIAIERGGRRLRKQSLTRTMRRRLAEEFGHRVEKLRRVGLCQIGE